MWKPCQNLNTENQLEPRSRLCATQLLGATLPQPQPGPRSWSRSPLRKDRTPRRACRPHLPRGALLAGVEEPWSLQTSDSLPQGQKMLKAEGARGVLPGSPLLPTGPFPGSPQLGTDLTKAFSNATQTPPPVNPTSSTPAPVTTCPLVRESPLFLHWLGQHLREPAVCPGPGFLLLSGSPSDAGPSRPCCRAQVHCLF